MGWKMRYLQIPLKRCCLRVKRRKYLSSFILISFIILCVEFIEVPWTRQMIFSEDNYLESKGDKSALIDLPGCFIPIEDEFPEPLQFIPLNCSSNASKITYVQGNKISVNSSYKDALCCYRGIIRESNTDNIVSKTEECVVIDEEVFIVDYDAVVVTCNYEGDLYNDYHAIVVRMSPFGPSNPEAPNVVIIGLDSISRFHFRSFMPKTNEILSQMGAVDLGAYSQVGSDAFPNFIPFITGYEHAQIEEFCYKSSEPIDECPFIWKNVSMVTALLEDAPNLTIFNNFKFGFLKPPTTYYLRPLMLTVSNDHKPEADFFPCVGSQPTLSFILEHLHQLLENDSPIFSISWMSGLARDNVEFLPWADGIFSDFIKSMNMTNTVLIFMSDHGYRFDNGRTSFNGWFNEKLPFFSIVIPPAVQAVLGKERMEALHLNAKQLTTPFDAYYTLGDIFEAYNLFENSSHRDPAVVEGRRIPRKFGQSLFVAISSDRTCYQAGIPLEFCPCLDLRPMDLTDGRVEKTVRASIAQINNWLPRRCRKIRLAQITAAAYVNGKEFIVGFTTNPGGFKFEAFRHYHGTLPDTAISRVSKINKESVWCAKDWFLELYCYCHLPGIISEYILGNKTN